MIKNLLLLSVATALISGCATLQEKPDPFVGLWEIQFSRAPGGNPMASLMISKEGSDYTGTLTNPTGEYALDDLTIEANGDLSAGLNYRGYSVKMSARIDGTSITGENLVQNTTIEFIGKKVE